MPRRAKVIRGHSPGELESELNRWLEKPEPATRPDLKVGPIHNMVQSQFGNEIVLTIIYQFEGE
jgi:hypothetical protein